MPQPSRILMSCVTIALLLATTLAGSLARPARAASEAEMLAAGRRLSVHRIDRHLPDQPLDQWFPKLVGPHAIVSWEINDCGEACGCPADTARDLPTCIEARATLDRGASAYVWIVFGTVAEGISGPPALFYSEVTRADHVTSHYDSLATFAKAIGRLRR